jgi:hypothetical protein
VKVQLGEGIVSPVAPPRRLRPHPRILCTGVAWAVALAVIAGGCRHASGGSLRRASDAAAAEQGIPSGLLLAIAWTETRFVPGATEDRERMGWIRLVPRRTARSPLVAAAMLRVPPGEIDRDPALGMRAAAALLLRAADPVPPAADSVANALYADGVLRAAARGIHGVDRAGEAIDVPPRAARAIDVLGPRAAPDVRRSP